MKACIKILILAVLFALPAMAMRAQVPLGCVPDCPGDNFGSPFLNVYTLPNGCQVRVQWAARSLACGRYYDVQIQRIEALNSLCYGMTPGAMLNGAIQELLEDNPMGFPPDSSGCERNWRVLRGACWQGLTSEELGNEMYPCTQGNVCCLTHFEVCIINGVRVVTRGETEQGSCGVITNPYCQYICD